MRLIILTSLILAVLSRAVLTPSHKGSVSASRVVPSRTAVPAARVTTARSTPRPSPRKFDPLGPSSHGDPIYHPNLLVDLRQQPRPIHLALLHALLPHLHEEWTTLLERYMAGGSNDERIKWGLDCRWLQAVSTRKPLSCDDLGGFGF